MNTANKINLIKFASGLILNQKNLAFFKESSFEENSGLLSEFGIDTSTILGGLLSENEEVLRGGIYGDGLGDVVDGVTSFILSTEPIDGSFSENSKVMSHPLEWNISNGNDARGTAQNYITDHSITLPNKVVVRMAMPYFLYKSLHREMTDLKENKTLLAIVSKMNVYHNMVLTAFKFDMDVKTVSRVVYTLNFDEIQVRFPQTNVSRSPDDSSMQQS